MLARLNYVEEEKQKEKKNHKNHRHKPLELLVDTYYLTYPPLC